MRARASALRGAHRLHNASAALLRRERDGIAEHRLAAAGEVASRRWRAAVGRRPVAIGVDRLLVGSEVGVTARRLAVETAAPLRPSTRVGEGALAAIVHALAAGELSDEQILASPFGREAAACFRHHGRLLGMGWAGDLPDRLRDAVRAATVDAAEPVPVRRIRGSACFQVQATTPTLIAALRDGVAKVPVRVQPGGVTTPLQDLLVRMSWLAGDRRLYQPIDAPELRNGWELVRQCRDRLRMMTAFLGGSSSGHGASYLDVASCYGWFVAEMRDRGYDAHGVERDELAVRCGAWVYGLRPDLVTVGEASTLLASAPRRFDVVSCFSLLHHLVIADERDAVGLVQRLDAVTGSVLFLDTGEGSEAWLRHQLPGWDPPFIATWLRRHTKFSAVLPLGTDGDRRPPNGDNYGRTLFACIR
jgi:hypothetical protein